MASLTSISLSSAATPVAVPEAPTPPTPVPTKPLDEGGGAGDVYAGIKRKAGLLSSGEFPPAPETKVTRTADLSFTPLFGSSASSLIDMTQFKASACDTLLTSYVNSGRDIPRDEFYTALKSMVPKPIYFRLMSLYHSIQFHIEEIWERALDHLSTTPLSSREELGKDFLRSIKIVLSNVYLRKNWVGLVREDETSSSLYYEFFYNSFLKNLLFLSTTIPNANLQTVTHYFIAQELKEEHAHARLERIAYYRATHPRTREPQVVPMPEIEEPTATVAPPTPPTSWRVLAVSGRLVKPLFTRGGGGAAGALVCTVQAASELPKPSFAVAAPSDALTAVRPEVTASLHGSRLVRSYALTTPVTPKAT